MSRQARARVRALRAAPEEVAAALEGRTVAAAAELLGISVRTLYALIAELGL